jgi:HK97 family phage portal protein
MGRFARLSARLFGPPPQPEERSDGGGGWGARSLIRGYGPTEPVNPNLAQSLSAVTGCVELISAAIGSLPASLVVDTAEGRVPAPASAAAWRLLTRPNPYQSWSAWATWAAASILLEGNAVSFLKGDPQGRVTGLFPAPWPWLLPTVIDGPRLVFDCLQFGTAESLLLGLPRRMLDTDVLHIRSRSDFGIVGRSVLSRAAEPLREGLEIATAAAANWKNGLRPSGVYSIEATLDEPARKRMRDAVRESNEGSSNVGRILVLDRGGKYIPTQMTSVDAEFLATRMFSVSEVCRLFCVPEPLLQIGQRLPSDMATFVTTFAIQALAPIVNAIEAEFDHSVLPAGMHLVIDMSALLRGNYSAVMAALATGTQSGITTANDARRSLGLRPLEGGDTLRQGPPPTWPADRPGMPALHQSPGPGGDLPNVDTHQGQGA